MEQEICCVWGSPVLASAGRPPATRQAEPKDDIEMKRSGFSSVAQRPLALFGIVLRPWTLLLRLSAQVREWHRIRTEIAALRQMDDRTLRDIGIHPGDLEHAVRRGYR
jgi:uncharacterized protein YjiS (DUF1127 family)